MLTKIQKLISLALAFLMLLTVFPTVSFADDSTSLSEAQITNRGGTRYYDDTGAEVTESPVLGSNAAVSVSKTIQGTDVENEFTVNLEVKTSVNITNVNLSSDAAVVLVLDLSSSMATNNRIGDLRDAACDFLDSYTAEAGSAVRYISLVVFYTDARVRMGWTNVADQTNLSAMKTMIQSLTEQSGINGATNIQGGLLFARNLLRTDVLPSGTGGRIIVNRSVILFSDGVPTHRSNTNHAAYSGLRLGTGASETAEDYAVTAADEIKNATSFTIDGGATYSKYTADLYTISYGEEGPAEWLRNDIATSPSHAFSGTVADQLTDAYESIAGSIKNWPRPWIVTDPMGTNIEFISNIHQNDIDTGILKYENNTLTWDLKQASPTSFADDIYTYKFSYRIRLDTTSGTFTSGTSYSTNGETGLTYAMVENGYITGDDMSVAFSVPAVKGYAGNLDFTKVGGGTEFLAGCAFTLTNESKQTHLFVKESEALTGKVSFANIPSGHTYSLEETSMPAAYQGTYLQSSETYTVIVSYGDVIIKDSKGNDVSANFTFNNPLREKPVKSVADSSAAGKNGASVWVGDRITYEISYANYDSVPATIVITDTLPTGVDFVSADNGSMHSGGVVTWMLTNVPAGVSDTVQVVVEVNASAVKKIENEATVQVGSNTADTTNKVENPVIDPATLVKVTYDPNGGTGTMVDTNSPYATNATVIILDNQFTRSGYTFAGFTIQGDTSGIVYASAADAITGTSGSFTITQDTVLLAQWKPLGSITINKYGEKDGDTLLPGAVFKIEQFTGTDPTEAQLADDSNWKTIYWDDTNSKWVNTDTGYVFKTDGSNGLKFSNLSEATYRITETTPPASSNADYALLKDSIVITIPLESTTSFGTGYTGKWTKDNGKYYYYDLTYTVTDAAVLELPSTGTGNWPPYMYVLIGITILIAATGCYIYYRKNRHIGKHIRVGNRS